MKTTRTALALTAALGGALVAGIPATASAAESRGATSTVYTETNAASGNAVLAYHSAGGALTAAASYATGGAGNGAGLGSQGAVTIADGGRILLAVNAGSGTVSAFWIDGRGALSLASTASSGGTTPISVTVHDDLVYVLNAGDNTISALRLHDGRLTAIAHSTRSLSSAAAGAAQVGFSPDGRRLVVTEKTSNTLDTFVVGRDGRASAAASTASVGSVPFGFDFDSRGDAVVSDAASSAVTTYRLGSGTAKESAYIADGQAAACWLVVSQHTGTAYVANAGTGTISTYSVRGGELSLTDAVAATVGGHPTDEALGRNDQLFVRDATNNRLQAVEFGRSGATVVDGPSDLPASASGIAIVER